MQTILHYIRKLDKYPLYWPFTVPLAIFLFITGTSLFQSLYWLLTLSFLVFIIIKSTNTNVIDHQANYEKLKKRRIPKSRQQAYADAGLTDQEIQFFRDEMAEALANIDAILSYQDYNSHISMLFRRHDIATVFKKYFAAITLAPSQLNQATDFLYQILPQMKVALEQYVAVNRQMDKSSVKIQKLTDLRNEISDLANKGQDSFDQFRKL